MNKDKRPEYKNLLREIIKEETSKKCPRCNGVLPATPDYFYRRKGGKYGLDYGSPGSNR